MEITVKVIRFLILVIFASYMIFAICTVATGSEQETELYYFGIDNCYFCALQKPLIVQLNANGFNFEIINATRPSPRIKVLLDKYSITRYPTIIIVTANKVIRIVGFRPLKVIREALK